MRRVVLGVVAAASAGLAVVIATGLVDLGQDAVRWLAASAATVVAVAALAGVVREWRSSPSATSVPVNRRTAPPAVGPVLLTRTTPEADRVLGEGQPPTATTGEAATGGLAERPTATPGEAATDGLVEVPPPGIEVEVEVAPDASPATGPGPDRAVVGSVEADGPGLTVSPWDPPTIIDLSGADPEEIRRGLAAGERELIEQLVDDGELTDGGPITDRDVETLVFVAVSTSDLLEALLERPALGPGSRASLPPAADD